MTVWYTGFSKQGKDRDNRVIPAWGTALESGSAAATGSSATLATAGKGVTLARIDSDQAIWIGFGVDAVTDNSVPNVHMRANAGPEAFTVTAGTAINIRTA
ncbi:MAG: hypothetical protein ACR2RE_03405 [Geminicoccaceae bacterium]